MIFEAVISNSVGKIRHGSYDTIHVGTYGVQVNGRGDALTCHTFPLSRWRHAYFKMVDQLLMVQPNQPLVAQPIYICIYNQQLVHYSLVAMPTSVPFFIPLRLPHHTLLYVHPINTFHRSNLTRVKYIMIINKTEKTDDDVIGKIKPARYAIFFPHSTLVSRLTLLTLHRTISDTQQQANCLTYLCVSKSEFSKNFTPAVRRN